MNNWPVIVHQSLACQEIFNLLRDRSTKVRDGVVEDSIIFPMSGVAFLLASLADCTMSDPSHPLMLNSDLVNRLDQLVHVHRNPVLLCQSPLHGSAERKAYSLIQQKYLHSSLQMIPVHNANEAVKCMLTIAKALCKPASDTLSERLEAVIAEQMFRPDIMVPALRHLGLSSHSVLLQDRLGSFQRLVTAGRNDLLDCSLDSQTVEYLLDILKPRPPEPRPLSE